MKYSFNLASPWDLERFASRDELLQLLQGFDGVELNYISADERDLLPRERVLGFHMSYFPCWLPLWRGDETALLREFGSWSMVEQVFGGRDREAILRRFRRDLALARAYGVEYAVFHISECTIEETFTGSYARRDEEVIEAAAELINLLLREEDGSIAFLMENLWQPGLRFTNPAMTRKLLDAVDYENKGIMLDTGHLLHTNEDLQTQEEGLAYIHSLLDAHGDLCRHIRGVHLNQSLTGAYCRRVRQELPVMEADYEKRQGQMFWHAFAVDQHKPFACPGVRELLQRIAPEYVTFEFITEDLSQHREFLQQQKEALGLT